MEQNQNINEIVIQYDVRCPNERDWGEMKMYEDYSEYLIVQAQINVIVTNKLNRGVSQNVHGKWTCFWYFILKAIIVPSLAQRVV